MIPQPGGGTVETRGFPAELRERRQADDRFGFGQGVFFPPDSERPAGGVGAAGLLVVAAPTIHVFTFSIHGAAGGFFLQSGFQRPQIRRPRQQGRSSIPALGFKKPGLDDLGQFRRGRSRKFDRQMSQRGFGIV